MTKPSWQDFGTYDESAYPELWDGVVGAWCPSLGPTGLRLHDHSRRNNWGTLTNMDNATDWTVSGGQYALDFDGTDDTVTHSDLTMTGAFGVSLWFLKRTNGIYDARILWGKFSDSDTYVGAVSTATINTQSDTGGTAKSYTFSVANNQWYHFALSRDASNGVRLYLNGVESTSGVQTVTGTYTLNRIGQYSNNSGGDVGFMWDGLLDDMTVFNRPLPVSEIQRLYLLGRGGMYERRRRTLRRVAVEQATGARRRRILTGMV